MAKKKAIDLSAFNDKLLDGLKFCIKVYDLLDQIHREPDGLQNIRLRKTKKEKRLLEELIPIARYIQAKYRAGNRFKVRWLSGSQPYDAIVWTPQNAVKHEKLPRKIYLEVTTSRHESTHLASHFLQENGYSFGPQGTKVDKRNRQIVSVPYVFGGQEPTRNLTNQIIKALNAKACMVYPPNTVLIINCETDGIVFSEEWCSAVQQVEASGRHNSFREVFLISSLGHHSASLWGNSKPGHNS